MRLISILVLAVFSCCAFAQPVSEDRRKDIMELLEITGSLKLGEQVGNAVSTQFINQMRQQQPNMPNRVVEIIQQVVQEHMGKFMNDPLTIDGMIDLYARHFTQDEIKEIIAFYKSPTGGKMTAEMPKLTAESMQFTQTRMATVIPALQQDLIKRLQAEGFGPQPAAPGPTPAPTPAQ